MDITTDSKNNGIMHMNKMDNTADCEELYIQVQRCRWKGRTMNQGQGLLTSDNPILFHLDGEAYDCVVICYQLIPRE